MAWRSRSNSPPVGTVGIGAEVEKNTIRREYGQLRSVETNWDEVEVLSLGGHAFERLILTTHPIRVTGPGRPYQHAGLALCQSVLEHANQLIASRQHDLIEKHLEPLLMQHVVQVQNPDAIHRSI
jgi:hypothetical protein